MRRLVARSGAVPADEPVAPAVAAEPAPATQARSAPRPSPAPAPAPAPARGTLTSVIQVAERSGRTDLSAKLRAHGADLRRTGVTVAIVGEFKKGKSTLVNALVNAEVCPGDPVYASIAPIAVAHGAEHTVTLVFADGRTETSVEDAAQLVDIASEERNEDNRLGLVRADVTVPRRLLAAGLQLVDMPGVGGLDSAIGALNLASLETTDGALFVSDCTQELTAPELSFLTAAKARCPAVICVMTKADMQHHTASIVARNRAHLDRHGLEDVPLLPVSSVVHLVALAQGDPALERESGFAALFDALHQRIWEPARRRALADAGRQLAELADHVAMPIEAERQALRSPAAAERTLQRLSELEDRVRHLRSAAARWQQRLSEGASDTASDLDHELRERMRSVARLAEARAETDSAGDDLVFEAWLHKATMDEIVAHYARIGARMSALSDEIAEHFVGLDRSTALQVQGEAPATKLAGLSISKEAPVVRDGLLRRIVTTGQGYSSGIVLTSSVLGVFGGAFLLVPALTLPVAGMMARRAFTDDRDRRRAARRVELKRMANRYLDEVGFIVHKDSRDAIRGLHRQLREHYAERAERLERTLRQARVAAEQARQRVASEPAAHHETLEQDADAVEHVRLAAARLVAAAPPMAVAR